MIEITKSSKELRKEIWDLAYKYSWYPTIERLNHIVKGIDNDTPTEIIIKLYEYLKDYDRPRQSHLYSDVAVLLFTTLDIQLPDKEIGSCCFFPIQSVFFEIKSFASAMLELDNKVSELQQSQPVPAIHP
ncbi:hypothetical protein [Legionella quateirensis]|uniref:Uncharacterized protein n=1 Tax=Legionella quateirensis TaxID=45072 RepID=A0A378KTZ5_9GAMM|nr:hypothetical protein [Legionella quateirensis]KTD51106.1 hypothetical protein Lqua_1333 [Legionella quateirensis]STY17649.1 Uncharacterised protein [Legionella quateirensis]